MQPGLAIFTKTPGFSPVKTRLARDIGNAAARRFHLLAAAATAEVAQGCSENVVTYWAVAEDDPLAQATWPGFPCLRQGGGGLGDRLQHVYDALRKRHGAALMIGTDIPQVTPELLLQAIRELQGENAPHVFGPASDGGFWLFGGTREIAASIWRRTPYSVPATGEALCRALGDRPIVRLPVLTDVDMAENLPALMRELRLIGSPTPGQARLARWLDGLHKETAGTRPAVRSPDR